MKKASILLTMLFLLTAGTYAQTLEELFQKYERDERFEYVSIGRGMLSTVQLSGAADDSIQSALLARLKGLKVLTLVDGFDDTLQKTVLQELELIVSGQSFETAAEVRSGTEEVRIYLRAPEGEDADMLVMTRDEAELCLIWLRGQPALEELLKAIG